VCGISRITNTVPFYRGWSVVLACGIIASLSWGLGFYGLGVYLHALNRLHGWSAGLISIAVTVYYAVSAGGIVLVGGFVVITLPPLLAREEFGQRSFGTVFGLVAATAQVGVALGPGLMGVLHDALGSYRPVLWCLVGLESLAVAAMLWGKALREGPSANHVDNRLGRA